MTKVKCLDCVLDVSAANESVSTNKVLLRDMNGNWIRLDLAN